MRPGQVPASEAGPPLEMVGSKSPITEKQPKVFKRQPPVRLMTDISVPFGRDVKSEATRTAATTKPLG